MQALTLQIITDQPLSVGGGGGGAVPTNGLLLENGIEFYLTEDGDFLVQE